MLRGCACRAQILFPLAEMASHIPDSAQYGVAENLYATPVFWLACALTALVGFGHRFIERGAVWLFRPQVPPPHLCTPCSYNGQCCTTRHSDFSTRVSRSLEDALEGEEVEGAVVDAGDEEER